MPMEKVAFQFPDPDAITADSVEMKEDGTAEIKIEGRRDPFEKVPDRNKAESTVEVEDSDDDDDAPIKIQVVSDVPEKDRKQRRAPPPEELTDEELAEYGDRARKRLERFSKGYHDERRAKEAALRERAELEAMTARLVEENKRLKGTVGKNQEALLEQAKAAAARELEDAKAKFKQAYDSGESEALVAAQEAMTAAKMKVERVNNFRAPTLQDDESEVQTGYAPTTSVDRRAVEWQKANPWFGPDDEMTSFALGLHQKLVKQGVNPQSDEYYEKINARMRQVFPDQFDDVDEAPEEEKPRRRATNVVAPATRSVAPKKVTLTSTQVALAKRLGVPLEEYAKQVAMELRKQNG